MSATNARRGLAGVHWSSKDSIASSLRPSMKVFFVDALLFERHFDADVDRQFMTGAGEGFYAFGRGGAR